MRVRMSSLSAAALGIACLVSVPTIAQNQSQAPSGSPANQPGGPADQHTGIAVTGAKLDATAAAMQKVDKIQQDYRQQVQSAKPADRQRIADNANTAAEQAVKQQGLSVDEYLSILQVAQNDPSVRQQLVERMNSAR